MYARTSSRYSSSRSERRSRSTGPTAGASADATEAGPSEETAVTDELADEPVAGAVEVEATGADDDDDAAATSSVGVARRNAGREGETEHWRLAGGGWDVDASSPSRLSAGGDVRRFG